MKHLIVYVILIISVASNAQLFRPYTFTSRYDKFDNYKVFDLVGNVLKQKDDFYLSTSADLNARCFISDSTVIYSLIVVYNSTSWLFIEDGEGLVMLIDGVRVGFTGKGSIEHRDVLTGGKVKETAYYPVSKKELRQIRDATKIEIKIKGDNLYEEFYFSEKNHDAFEAFCERYVDKEDIEVVKMPITKNKASPNAWAGFAIGVILIAAVLLSLRSN